MADMEKAIEIPITLDTKKLEETKKLLEEIKQLYHEIKDLIKWKYNVENVDNFVDNFKGGV